MRISARRMTRSGCPSRTDRPRNALIQGEIRHGIETKGDDLQSELAKDQVKTEGSLRSLRLIPV